LGDLNAKIGREEIYRLLKGRHGLHLNTNNNGKRLVDFSAAKNMLVSSTCYPHKEIQNKPGDLQLAKPITKQCTRCKIIKSCRGANSGSDNFLAKGKCRCRIAYRNYEINRNRERFNVERPREPSIITDYQLQLGKEFETVKQERAGEELTHVHEEWKQLKRSFSGSSRTQ
jgi:hypothetical protein